MQERVNAYFQSSASYWSEVYETDRLLSEIFRHRQGVALSWISELALRPAARILEIGCGAGLVSTALARAGYSVEAIDAAPAMVDLARQNAVRCGVSSHVTVNTGDAHALAFGSEAFDLVAALGVIPWLHSAPAALSEMQRVLRPGGYLLVTADNDRSLNRMLDPLSTPVLAPVRRAAKAILGALGIRRPVTGDFHAVRHSPSQVDRMLEACGLVKLKSRTLGYGPFTFCGRAGFSEAVSIRIDRALERLADRNIAPLRMMGSHYLVLTEKPCK